MKHLLILLTVALLTGCDNSESSTTSGLNGLYTIRHDSHLFVIYSGMEKGGIIHHPGCPCLQKTYTDEKR